MGSAFHQLCPRYSGTLTPTAPMAIRLWDTLTFFYISFMSSEIRGYTLKTESRNLSIGLDFYSLFSLLFSGFRQQILSGPMIKRE